MFWNRAKKTKAPYEVQKAPAVFFRFEPKADITIHELIEILQQYITGGGTALPHPLVKTEIPAATLSPHLMRHMRQVER